MAAYLCVRDSEKHGREQVIGPFPDDDAAHAFDARYWEELNIPGGDGGYRFCFVASDEEAITPAAWEQELKDADEEWERDEEVLA